MEEMGLLNFPWQRSDIDMCVVNLEAHLVRWSLNDLDISLQLQVLMTEQDYLAFTCPGCQSTFPSPGALSGHVNDTGGSCYLSKIPYSVSPSLYQQPGEDIRGSYHPTSAYVYGKGETGLDKMQADVHER